MAKQIGVYQVEFNGKRYIGSTTRGFEDRWWQHLSALRRGKHDNRNLQDAYNKYGEDALRFSILEAVETPDECIILEQFYVDTLKPEYNFRLLAKSNLGIKHSEEARAKNRAAQLGHKVSEETKTKLRAANKGKTLSEEHKAKIGAAHRGIPNKPLSEETKLKLSMALQGRTFSEEHRAKISAAKRGKTITEEHKAKISVAKRGKTISRRVKHV